MNIIILFFYLIMSSINDIKKSIIKKVEDLITIKLNNYKETNRLSTSLIGNEISKIINNEMIELKKEKKQKKIIIKEEINIEDKNLQSITYKIYMKNMIKKLKEENKKNKKNILELFEEAYDKWKKEEKK